MTKYIPKPPGDARLRPSSAYELAQALGAKRSGRGYITNCPSHGDNTPSLSFKDGDKSIVFKCYAGCSSSEVVDALKDNGLWHGRTAINWQPPRLREYDEQAERLKRQRKAQELWDRSEEVKPGDPVHTYLTDTRKLKLDAIPADIRIAPSLEYWTVDDQDKPRLVAKTPAMVAAARSPLGELLAVHRTYLSLDGTKFDTEARNLSRSAPIKKVLGSIDGGAIHLHEPGDILLVAEGIETALAAHILSGGLPAWSAISSSNVARLEVPACVKSVIVCVDNDPAGRRAAAVLTERLQGEGRQVEWSEPGLVMSAAKCDWADYLLMKEGAA